MQRYFYLTTLCLLFSFFGGYATSYTWNGSISQDWATTNNWTPAGVPSAGDTVTIDAVENIPMLDLSRNLNVIVVNSGAELDLNAYTLTITQFAYFTEARVFNGYLVTSSINAATSRFSATLTANANQLNLTNNRFNEPVSLSYSGAGLSSNGGNLFLAAVSVAHNGTGKLAFGYENPDSFEDSLHAKVLNSGAISFADSSESNLFNGYCFFERASSSTGNGVLIGNLPYSAVFTNTVEVCANTQTADLTLVSVGFNNCFFDSTATLQIHPSGFNYGLLRLSATTITSPVALNLSNHAGFLVEKESDIHEPIQVTAPNLFLHEVIFRAETEFTKTGRDINHSWGPITAHNNLELNNTGGGELWILGSKRDVFHGNVSLHNSHKAGSIVFSSSSRECVVEGNLNIHAVRGKIGIATKGQQYGLSVSGHVTANADSGSIFIEHTAIGPDGSLQIPNLKGNVWLAGLQYEAATPFNVNLLNGNGRLSMKYCEFRTKVNLTVPGVTMSNTIFHDSLTVTSTVEGLSSWGGLECFGPATFNAQQGSGLWQLNSNGLANIYHGAVNVHATGSALFNFGADGQHLFYDNLFVESSQPFGPENGTWQFKGSSNQSIQIVCDSILQLDQLNLDKEEGTLTLNNHLDIKEALTLNRGILKVTPNATLGLSENATTQGGSDSSYVEGFMSKQGTAAFTFPLGGNGSYAPLGIDAVASSSTFKAKYIAVDPDSLYPRSQKDTTLGFINRCGYWNLDRTAGTQNTKVTLGWSNNPCFAPNPADAKVARWGSGIWNGIGNSTSTGDSLIGNVKSTGSLSSFPVNISIGAKCSEYFKVSQTPDIDALMGGYRIFKVLNSERFDSIQFYKNNLLVTEDTSQYKFNYSLNSDIILIHATNKDNCKLERTFEFKDGRVNGGRHVCGHDDDELRANAGLGSCACNGNFANASDFSPEQTKEWYIDNYQSIPNLKAKVNFHIICDPNNTQNNYNEYHIPYLQSAFNFVRSNYLVNNSPSPYFTPFNPPVSQLPSTKIDLELNDINFIRVQDLWDVAQNCAVLGLCPDNSFLPYLRNNYNCKVDDYINVFFVENGFNCPTGGQWNPWGNVSSVGGCDVNSANYVLTVNTRKCQEVGDSTLYANNTPPNEQNWNNWWLLYRASMLSTHLEHEIGHLLHLNHLYNSELRLFTDLDLLDDALPELGQPKCIANQSPLNADLCFINDRYNPMGGDTTNTIEHNFTPKQIGRMLRAASNEQFQRYIVGSPYSPVPIEIDQDHVWRTDSRVYSDIIIKPGTTFTVQCTLSLPDQARIVVEPGAVLYLDGGTLTGFHKMWQGVSVLGSANQSQGTVNVGNDGTLISANSPQGVVIIKNGTIENAEEGIFVGRGLGDLQYDKTGGIVIANGATFKNNFRSVAFNPYKSLNVKSYFKNCTFICDAHLKNPDYYIPSEDRWQASRSMVTIWECNGIKFYGNRFENTIEHEVEIDECGTTETRYFPPFDRTNGIGAWDSKVIVQSYDPNEPNAVLNNDFVGLRAGIEFRNNNPLSHRHLWSYDSHFKNVHFGITLENPGMANIVRNEFQIASGEAPTVPNTYYEGEPYGIYAFKYSGVNVTNSNFTKFGANSTSNWSLVLRGDLALNNSANLKGNTFSELPIGIQTEVTSKHLQIDCNSFTNMNKELNIFPADLSVADGARFFPHLGTGCFTPDIRVANIFNDPGPHIWHNAISNWRYYYRDAQPIETPVFFNGSNGYNGNGADNGCSGDLVDPCASSGGGDGVKYSAIQNARRLEVAEIDATDAILNAWQENNGLETELLDAIADTSIATDSLIQLVVTNSPLSDTVISAVIYSGRNISTAQAFSLFKENLPVSNLQWESCSSFLAGNRAYDGIVDTLRALQYFNPNTTTKTALLRHKQNHEAQLSGVVREAIEYCIEKDSLHALIPLYRDSLIGKGYERHLLGIALDLDSMAVVNQVLDSLPTLSDDDSLFKAYSLLTVALRQDSITWFQLDSLQLENLRNFSRIPSSIQNNALSARLLIGDTLYHHNPDPSPAGNARLAAPAVHNAIQANETAVVRIMPNPNQGIFQVHIQDGLQGTFYWEMVDLTGRIMLQGRSNQSMFVIHAAQLSKGIYLLKMRAPNGTQYKVERVIIR